MFTNLSFYLDFLVALVFSIAIGSIILSVAFELYAYYIKLRANFLKKIIDDVLNDKRINYNYTELFYSDPQIDLTKKTYRHLPEYISYINFAQTLINTVIRTHETAGDTFQHTPDGILFTEKEITGNVAERFKVAVDKMQYSDLKLLLSGFVQTTDGNSDVLIKNIGNWYQEYMKRAGGWYKMIVQKKMVIIALIACLVFNVDFFRVSRTLLHDKELTKRIATIAQEYKAPVDTIKLDSLPDEQRVQVLQKSLDSYLHLIDSAYNHNAPVGWQSEGKLTTKGWNWLLWKLLGCIVMAICLSMGAPFWFDLLNNLVNLRKTGNKPVTPANII